MALAEIVANKHVEVAERMRRTPHAELVAQAERTDRDFFAALGTSFARRRFRVAPRFVLECKRGSPSRGIINAALDPVSLAGVYEPWAAAISVLTDSRYFAGSFDDLRAVRAATRHPVLCKDFVVAPYQVTEARCHGADAVLLMLSVLDDSTWRACRDEAVRLGMGWLTEVHDALELERAIALEAPVIGINNRDLKTLHIDLATTERLAERVPSDRVVISESGITMRSDILRLAPHCDGYLIGSALSGSTHPDRTLRALIMGRTKICGLTRAEDAAEAWRQGATHGGVVLAPSRRRVDVARAAEVFAGAPLSRVAVFVNEDLETVTAIARELRLETVQLHGDEDLAYVARLDALLPPDVALWIARRGPPFEARAAAGVFPSACNREIRWLFDTALAGGERGGTGVAFERGAIANRPDIGECIVAGGIADGNVDEAARLGSWALDVSSGVEDAPGIKSAARLAALFGRLYDMDATRGGHP